MKFIRVFLLVLIIIGLGFLVTQKIWVPKLVDSILKHQTNVTYQDPYYNLSFDYPKDYHIDDSSDPKYHGILLIENAQNNNGLRVDINKGVDADWEAKYTIPQDMSESQKEQTSPTITKLSVNGRNAYKAEGYYIGPGPYGSYEKFYTFDSPDGKTNISVYSTIENKAQFPNELFDLITSSIKFTSASTDK